MNQMVVAVFDDESAAFEGLRELRELHADFEVRSKKLGQALKLAKEALAA